MLKKHFFFFGNISNLSAIFQSKAINFRPPNMGVFIDLGGKKEKKNNNVEVWGNKLICQTKVILSYSLTFQWE